MGQYKRPDGTKRRTPAVPGATADNGDFPCFGQLLPHMRGAGALETRVITEFNHFAVTLPVVGLISQLKQDIRGPGLKVSFGGLRRPMHSPCRSLAFVAARCRPLNGSVCKVAVGLR